MQLTIGMLNFWWINQIGSDNEYLVFEAYNFLKKYLLKSSGNLMHK